jgi:hypothetical protein
MVFYVCIHIGSADLRGSGLVFLELGGVCEVSVDEVLVREVSVQHILL